MLTEKIKKNIRKGTFLKVSWFFIIHRLFYHVILYYYKVNILTRSLFCNTVIRNPYEVVVVPTKLIHNTFIRFSKYRGIMFEKTIRSVVGLIRDGDWDLDFKQPFISSSDYTAFKERFTQGKEWEDTVYYEKYLEKSKKDERYPSWQEYKLEYLDLWEEIYNDIKENGYKKQSEINSASIKKNRSHYDGKPENEVEVAVSRTGELIFIDGRHRLSIALLLNIERIPVVINCWHKSYIDRVKKGLNKNIVTPSEVVHHILKENQTLNDHASSEIKCSSLHNYNEELMG